ncbi:MAG: OmpH family outer membrane protein [Prevotella sp.]|nr:OmpH family outer membrane protein [Prevotella sp.]
MMKKNLFKVMAMAAVAALTFSCSDNAKSDAKSPAAAGNSSQLIAFVEVDSIMSQYDFCKEMKAQLESKGQNIDNALKGQEQNLQAAVQNFQSKLQNNGFSSRQEAENQQAAIERQQQQYVAAQQRLSAEFQNETAKFQQALIDSLQHFLADYNKDKKYAFILTKQLGDNILYADNAYDITEDVVAGLNKAYKPGKKEEKK